MVVVFFSRAGENYEVGEVTVGNTAKLAQEVARRTDSPMIEITRTEPYPERYAATSEMVQEEQRVNARPLFTLSGDVDALDSSDTVFLGYPIWCGDMPMPVYAFLENRDWSGKTIYPFCTHGGSGLGRTPERITAITKTTVKPGLAVMGPTHRTTQVKPPKPSAGGSPNPVYRFAIHIRPFRLLQHAFELEQTDFGFNASRITGETAVSADDPMAGHDKRDRIVVRRSPDGACGYPTPVRTFQLQSTCESAV